jgi:hypothetical protein
MWMTNPYGPPPAFETKIMRLSCSGATAQKQYATVFSEEQAVSRPVQSFGIAGSAAKS